MKISDLIGDAELFLYDGDKNKFFNLKIESVCYHGVTEQPTYIILSKNGRISENDLFDPKRWLNE